MKSEKFAAALMFFIISLFYFSIVPNAGIVTYVTLFFFALVVQFKLFFVVHHLNFHSLVLLCC